MLDSIWQDLRYAFRSLRRAPALAAAITLTLALGIGANTTIFSLVQAVMLRTAPVGEPENLYFVLHDAADGLGASSNVPWLERVRARADVFESVTAYSQRRFKVSARTGLESLPGQHVSGNYHATLRVPMALGRGFSAENDRVPGASPVAVISDGYWARRYNRSPDVIGQSLVVNGHRVTIVGVTRAGFTGLASGDSVDITLPLSMRLLDDPGLLTATDSWIGMPIVVRLENGVSEARASAAAAAEYRKFMAEPFNEDFRRTLDDRTSEALLQAAARGDDSLRRDYATSLYVLMGMVSIVLLIACVNVANLLLARAEGRTREMAIRLALGASRLRLVRQCLVESVLLALSGGAVGFELAGAGTAFVATVFATGGSPVVVDLQPDTRVLLFTGAVSILTGMAFGLVPAMASTQVHVGVALKTATLGGAALRTRLVALLRGRQILVAAQLALSLVLVFGAGLLVRTLHNLRTVDGGFLTEGVTIFSLDARDTPVPATRLPDICADVVTRLASRPGVVSGTCSTMSPIATSSEGRVITVDGVAPRSSDPDFVFANSVDARYFSTMGIGILDGRGIEDRDRADGQRVAVISETLARHYYGDTSPIGQTFRWGRRVPSEPVVIVGVARDSRRTLRDAPPPMIYTPLDQRFEASADLLVAIRSQTSPGIAALVPAEVRAVTRDVAVGYVRSMDEQIDGALVAERVLASLSSAFAVLALLLACIGIYGVMAHDVARRTRQIGIRLALGATPEAVLAVVLRHAVTIAALGLAGGAAASAAASRAVEGLIFGVEPRDPMTFIVAATLLVVTALAAAYLPARRAAHVDPAIALRVE
jgi:predicted permease